MDISFSDFVSLSLKKRIKTVNGDPGFIKVDQAVQYATVIELAESAKLDSSSLCTSSLIKRPLRSKFCGTSNRLVAKFDHYCPWVNNAVGAGNHKVRVSDLGILSPSIFFRGCCF